MGDVPTDRRDGAGEYEIAIKGHLTARWNAWFDGLSLTAAGDGTTVLAGYIPDQAALHAVLRLIADLGLPLISVISKPLDEPRATRSTPDPY